MGANNTEGPGRRIRRREFVQTTVTAAVCFGAGVHLARGQEESSTSTGEIPTRPLGKTGVKVSIVGLGGYHIGTLQEESAAIELIRAAIDRGITFMDNCWDYHNGKSEEWMGNALKDGYRDKVFLMTKIDGQTRESAAKQIDECLQRLKTDRIDLMQFHEVIRPGDPDRILGQDGAIEAVQEAQKAGKIRFLGFTGHKDPEIHLKMLNVAAEKNVRIDAVQMPLNVLDAHFKSFEKRVLPRLVKDQIGVLGMKSMGSGHVLKTKAASAEECLKYALSLPTSTVITGIETKERLDQAVRVASSFQPLRGTELAALLERTKPHAQEGKFEPFKTTTDFDGTVHNPHWLG